MALSPGIIILGAVAGMLIYCLLFVGRRERHLPPGPPTIPILGNAHQIPSRSAHSKFTQWAKQYGGVFSLKLGRGTAIVVTDRRAVREIFDQKSAVSSGRPVSTVAQQLVGKGDHLLVMDHGQKWRRLRKLIQQEVTAAVCEREYVSLQEAEAVQMLRDFLEAPDLVMDHPKRFSNSVIMSIIFGTRTPDRDTPHMARLYGLLHHFQQVMELGATPPVDFFPFLKWVPERFLGNWVSRASKVGREMDSLYGDVLQASLTRREQIGSNGSVMDKVLDVQDKISLTRHELDFLGGVAMEGGSETTSATLLSFIKAMVCFPEAQKKAQAELDAVIGEDASPRWSDREKLPVVLRLVKETMRWRPVAGTNVPHALSEDVWFDGMLLPKGSVLLLNIWGLHMDEDRYPEPDKFDPDRHLGRVLLANEYAVSSDYGTRDHYNYGAGRRLCPGIHLAERNLFVSVAKLLWAFSFEKKLDENGRPIEVDTDYATGYDEGLVVCSKPFECKITPRSSKRAETILKEFKQAEVDIFQKYTLGVQK